MVSGIGFILTLAAAIIIVRNALRHSKTAGLISRTPITKIADFIKDSDSSFRAIPAKATRQQATGMPNLNSGKSEPSPKIIAAVEGCVVAAEKTCLTAPMSGESCVAYRFRVYHEGEEDDTEYIKDSRFVRWSIDDGTGLAKVWPSSPPPWKKLYRAGRPAHSLSAFGWPETEATRGKLSNSVLHGPLVRVISRYGAKCLPSQGSWLSDSYEELSWSETILKEYGQKLFFIGPCSIKEDYIQFDFSSNLLLCAGSREDALLYAQQSAKRCKKWAVIWLVISAICAFVYLLMRLQE